MNELIPFVFQDVQLKEACWIDKKPYFTERAIGEWLGYGDQYRSIRRLVARNPHILPFRTVVNLTTVEGGREVTRELPVYDPIGLQLIVMESHQPKAIAYKIAVAHLVAAYMRGEITFAGVRRIPETLTIETLAQVAPYTRGIETACAALALEMGKPNARSVRALVRKIRNGEPIRQPKAINRRDYVHKKYRDKYDDALRLRAMGMKIREISQKLDVPLATVGHWVKGKAA